MTKPICPFPDCNRPVHCGGLCGGHYAQFKKGQELRPLGKRSLTPMQRFWLKVDKRPSGCWIWTACRNAHGYGKFGLNGKTWLAHRFAYTMLRGEIPGGLVLDHLCRTPACVNPSHLEPVTNRENSLRGEGPRLAALQRIDQTFCKHGHPLFGENLYRNPTTGHRYCRICIKRWRREWFAKNPDYKPRRKAG
jgi:hypothetical protein